MGKVRPSVYDRQSAAPQIDMEGLGNQLQSRWSIIMASFTACLLVKMLLLAPHRLGLFTDSEIWSRIQTGICSSFFHQENQ